MGRNIEQNLEGLRGIAAFMVVFGHIFFYPQFLDPAYQVTLPGKYLPPGHFSVLIFFCLSGFVIGHTNRSHLSGIKETGNYLLKRFIRLYPIYLVSVLVILPLVFTADVHGWKVLFGHLTFTNVLFGEIYFENNPLWSLNYEVLYYLLFIPLSYFKIPRGKAIVCVLVLALLNTLFHTRFNFPLVTSYLLGYAFWLTGLKISEYTLKKESIVLDPLKVLSLFLLAFVLPAFISFTGIEKVFQSIETPKEVLWVHRAVGFRDLFILPFCAAFILLLTNTAMRFRSVLLIFLYATPVVCTIVFLVKGGNTERLLIPLVIFGLSLLLAGLSLLVRNKDNRILDAITYSGGISYAVYAFHFPLLFLFGATDFFSGTQVSYITRFLVFLFVVVLVAIVAEKYGQPLIKRLFIRTSSKREL